MSRRSWHIFLILVGVMLSSCNVTRNLQEGQYFVQQIKIETDKETPRAERITSDELKNYLRQDINKRFLGINLYAGIGSSTTKRDSKFWNKIREKMGEEPILLSESAVKLSCQNFKNYMDSRGFFSSWVECDVDTLRKPKRAYITFKTHQGNPYRISTTSYEFRDKGLEALILSSQDATLIKSGEIFDIATLSAERERIASLVRDRGYYYFTVNNIEYLADTLARDYTVGLKTIIKQNLVGYNQKGEPIMKDNQIYRVGQINVFPEFDPLKSQDDQALINSLDTVRYRNFNIIYEGKPNIRPKVVRSLVPITSGYLYKPSRISNTYDRLMSTGYFKSAKIAIEEDNEFSMVVRDSRDTTRILNENQGFLNYNIYCTPALKQSFSIELEGSITSSFYGLKATAGYQNRNLFKGAESFDFDVTMGYEYMRARDAKKRNAIEFGVAAGLTFPRFLLPFLSDLRRFQSLTTPRTKVNVSVNFQDRPYYRRTLSNASWGYSWSYHGSSSFSLRPVDITIIDMAFIDDEFYNSLQNRYLQNSYSSQLISAMSFTYSFSNQAKNLGGNATLLRVNAEISGNIVDGLCHWLSKPAPGEDYYNLFGIRYSQYFRLDASVSRKIMLGEKSAIAGRLYGGFGIAYGNSDALPMDRLFYSGGSNSMRGWTPRMLGPGTVPLPKDSLYPTQLGDMRLEANLEFRFPIWGLFHGATFFDVGNIWFLRRNDAEYSPDAVFHIKDFYKSLGFNTGIGIRLDIKFAVLRLDWGIQLHNPNNPAGERWIHNFRWSNTALNFGVGYPF